MRQFTIFFFALAASVGWAHSPLATNGWCQYEYSTPEIPSATCYIPKCPTGADCICPSGDCEPPHLGQGHLAFQEPVLVWSESCVLNGKRSPCYEMTTPFQFRLSASDRSPVASIGFELAIDTDERRTFVMVWSPPHKSTNGSLVAESSVKIQSRPGTKLTFKVLKLCARDSLGNQACKLVD